MSAKDPNISKIGKYLKGQLDVRAMHQLEREAQNDPFLMEALEGYEAVDKDQEANVDDLKERLARRIAPKKERSVILWRVLPIAACLLLMFGLGYLFLRPNANQPRLATAISPEVSNKKPNALSTVTPDKLADIAKVKSTHNNTKLNTPVMIDKYVDPQAGLDRYLAKNTGKKNVIVKDLLKKMEGLTVDSNGLIAQNKPVVKAKLNGKDYMGGSVEQAVKNLPADIINKVQVIDDYSGQAALKEKKGAMGVSSLIATDTKLPLIIQSKPGAINAGGFTADSLNKSSNQFYGAKTKSVNSIIITGKILDANTKEPMAATTVGTDGKALTQADIDGKYSVVVKDGATLTFNYLGYVPQTIKLTPGQKSLNINLVADGKSLSETVIRGYVKRKADAANNSSYVISGKEVADNPITNKEQLLQGKVAGLTVQSTPAPKKGFVTLTGTVIDKNGVPITGALVKNGTSASNTDNNGAFRIIANPDSALHVASLGSRSQSVKLAPGQTNLNVKLEPEERRLAEVAVRGYVKRSRDQTTGASYIITGKDKDCKENARFKRRFFKKIGIAEKYVAEHAAGDSAKTISDGKFLRAVKFIKKRVPVSIPVDQTSTGYADLKTLNQNKSEWLKWYEANKCNNLK